MSDTVLLRFLDRGLINVVGDDAKLGKLQATSAEIAAVLKKNPDKTLAFSLIAFDPQAPPSDPVVVETLEILKTLWPTYVNTFAGVPNRSPQAPATNPTATRSSPRAASTNASRSQLLR